MPVEPDVVPERKPSRRRLWKFLPPLLILVALSIVGIGVEYLRWRNNAFDDALRSRGGDIQRVSRIPAFLTNKYLEPAAKWLQPVLPADVAIRERNADADRLRQLRSINGLNMLTLDKPNIEESELAALGDFRDLESLSVNGPQVTDNALHFLLRLKKLRTLHLRDTSITNASLEKLEAFGRSLSPKRLYVDLTDTSVRIARNVEASVPSVVRCKQVFNIPIRFEYDQVLPQSGNMWVVIETREHRKGNDYYIITQTGMATLQNSPTRIYSCNIGIQIPSPGDQRWSIRLQSAPYGSLSVVCTLAEGVIRVEPATTDQKQAKQ